MLTLTAAILFFLALYPAIGAGATLEEISGFAKNICDDIRPEGTITRQEVEGKLRGEANGIARLMGLTVGADGKLRHDKTDYKGLPFEKIADQMQDARACRREVAGMLIQERKRLEPPRYRTCRHPDFGQIGWRRSDVVNGNSGWRGGGSSPANWCSELKGRIVKERALGPQHEMKVLDSSERSRRQLGHVTYNYSCSIKVNWEPIYEERTDSRCGVIQ